MEPEDRVGSITSEEVSKGRAGARARGATKKEANGFGLTLIKHRGTSPSKTILLERRSLRGAKETRAPPNDR